MRYKKSILFCLLVSVFIGSDNNASVAQSSAAMQVCADILAQYGIAPEGCDPHEDTKVEKKPEQKDSVVAKSASLSRQERLRLSENNVFFRVGGNTLDTKAIQKLNVLGQVLNTRILGDTCIRLVGHSDSSGPADVNMKMGLKRANTVAEYLRPRLNDPKRIRDVQSAGEENLINSIKPDSPLHRRVTILARRCPLP